MQRRQRGALCCGYRVAGGAGRQVGASGSAAAAGRTTIAIETNAAADDGLAVAEQVECSTEARREEKRTRWVAFIRHSGGFGRTGETRKIDVWIVATERRVKDCMADSV